MGGFFLRVVHIALHFLVFSWSHHFLTPLRQPGKVLLKRLAIELGGHLAVDSTDAWVMTKGYGIAYTLQTDFAYLSKLQVDSVRFSNAWVTNS